MTLGAGNNLTLTTADESNHAASVEQKKKSGFSGTGGIGFSLGKSSQKVAHDDSSNVQKVSVAGSSAGSLTLALTGTVGSALNIAAHQLPLISPGLPDCREMP